MNGQYHWGDISAINFPNNSYKHTYPNGCYKNPADALALSFEATLGEDESTRNNSIASNDPEGVEDKMNFVDAFGSKEAKNTNLTTDSLNLSGDLEISDITDLVTIINSANYNEEFAKALDLKENLDNYDSSPEKDTRYTVGELAILKKLEKLEAHFMGTKTKLSTPIPAYSSFLDAEKFVLTSKKKSLFKLLAGHGVVGSFFGANGHRIQALQHEYDVTVSVTTKRIHFPGSNNKGVLLFQGKLTNILRSLRPLFRAMQEETVRLLLDDENYPVEKIKLEVEVLVPESLRFTMDRNREFKKIMETSGCNVRVIKQTYEDMPVQERVLVIFGTQQQVEIAIEKVALLIQDDFHLKHYGYMKYPDLTVAKSLYK